MHTHLTKSKVLTIKSSLSITPGLMQHGTSKLCVVTYGSITDHEPYSITALLKLFIHNLIHPNKYHGSFNVIIWTSTIENDPKLNRTINIFVAQKSVADLHDACRLHRECLSSAHIPSHFVEQLHSWR